MKETYTFYRNEDDSVSAFDENGKELDMTTTTLVVEGLLMLCTLQERSGKND